MRPHGRVSRAVMRAASPELAGHGDEYGAVARVVRFAEDHHVHLHRSGQSIGVGHPGVG